MKLCVSSCFSTRDSSGVRLVNPCTGTRMRPSFSAPTQPGARVMSANACCVYRITPMESGGVKFSSDSIAAKCISSARRISRASSGSRRAAVAQREVAALVFPVVFLFLVVALRLVERRLHFRIRPQRQRALPFGDRLIQLVHPVVGPARQLRHVRIVRSHAARTLEILERRFVFAAPQMQIRHVHQDHRILRRIRQRDRSSVERMFHVAACQLKLRRGVQRPRRHARSLPRLPSALRLPLSRDSSRSIAPSCTAAFSISALASIVGGVIARFAAAASRRIRHRHGAALLDVIDDRFRQGQFSGGCLIANLVAFLHDA